MYRVFFIPYARWLRGQALLVQNPPSLAENLSGGLAVSFILLFFLSFLFALPLSYAQNLDNPLASQIKQTLTKTKIVSETLYAKAVLLPFYEQKGYQPAWDQLDISSLLKAIGESKEEGLKPEHYHLKAIQNLLSQEKSNNFGQQASLDILLSDAFLLLASHYQYGFVNPLNHRPQWFVNKKDRDWVFFLNEALAQGTITSTLKSLLPRESGYTLLRKELAKVEPTSQQLCQIKANLDRHRSLLPKLEKKYILVNIPDFKLSIFQNEKVVFDSKVIVGRVDRKSPLLDDQIEYLVFSPSWHVPTSIAVKDKLPDIQKDPAYLKRMGFKVYQEGKIVDPDNVDWSKVTKENFSYHLAQDPGGGNALGRVKFMFPNKHDVYLHDTPSKSLFERERRTFSSGCIRLEKPVELAKYILDNKSEWDEESIKKAMFSGNQKNVKLDEVLPIHLAYLTAWIDEDNQLQLRNDIYGLDKVYEKNICK